MEKEKLFSREALDKLRSPEKLNTLIPVTNPIAWVGLVALCVLMFSIVLWSVFGAFTERAAGMGLIMDSAGVVNISHAASGKITDVYVKTGDTVYAGQLIAHMEQPERVADTQMAQYGTDLASNDRDVLGKVYQYDAKLHQQKASENIYSDHDGIVDEVMIEKGSIISSGSPICTVRLTQNREELTGIFYVPVDKGKQIESGMLIQLAPNGVDVSKTGSLIGVVRSISQYPISGQGIQKSLGNSQLANWIVSQGMGGAIEVKFDLVKDKDDESGYLWTSLIGEHKPITAGSFCTGSIIIERQPPIERVFYKFSQLLRSR